MRILITGNIGYVGPVVVRQMQRRYPSADLIGYAVGFFDHCLSSLRRLPERLLSRQHFGDVRDLPAELLDGVAADLRWRGAATSMAG